MKEVVKPWGKEEWLETNDRYVVKRLTMNKGCRCSLQYHEKKRETVYVLSGKLKITIGPDEQHLEDRVFLPNESVTLEPGVVHRMEGVEDSVYLEASTIELDDVVRLKDDYNRAK